MELKDAKKTSHIKYPMHFQRDIDSHEVYFSSRMSDPQTEEGWGEALKIN